MKTIFIPTQVDDSQALAVAMSLERLGHRPVLWFGADYPTRQSGTFRVSNQEFSWHGCGNDFDLRDEEIDSVWLRRPNFPYAPIELVHPGDRWAAFQELKSYFESIWYTIGRNAAWINDPIAARRASNKPLQLQLAPHCGLHIPRTLISNDPAAIREFIRENLPTQTVFKTFFPANFKEEGTNFLGRTAVVSLNDLPSDEALRLVPGIFQQCVKKAYELRVTYMGNHYVAMKIESQRHEWGETDWRLAPLKQIPTALCELPQSVARNCRRLMEQLDIVFGCFDFIVTPENDYVFLEVNESGQFLFVEDLHPAARLLDAFSEFLINPGCDFEPTFSAPPLRFTDLLNDATFRDRLQSQGRLHLQHPRR